jgi:hypothetical protein
LDNIQRDPSCSVSVAIRFHRNLRHYLRIFDPTILVQIAPRTTTTVTQTGVGLEAAIAVVCSWQRNRFHHLGHGDGILSWINVKCFALATQPD